VIRRTPPPVALQPQSVAVVFHFVEPLRSIRDDGRFGGEAELKGLKHASKIGGGSEKNEIRG